MLGEDSDTAIADYFRANLLQVRNAVSPADFKKFAALSSNGERINFVLNYPEAHTLPLEVENAPKKDLKKALQIKEVGNKYYGAGDYMRALENYTSAILIAPRKGNLFLYLIRL